MKIIAQSGTVKQVPYAHLGYLATTTTTEYQARKHTNAGGWLLVGLGLFLVITAMMGKFRGRESNIIKRHLKKWLLCGVVMMGLGVVLVVMFPTRNLYKAEKIYVNPEIMTITFQEQIASAIQQHQKDGGEVPLSIAELLPEAVAASDPMENPEKDGWRRPMRFSRSGRGPKATYKIHSAGADGAFDTSDDIGVLMTADGKRTEFR